jgi:hypothetical protein
VVYENNFNIYYVKSATTRLMLPDKNEQKKFMVNLASKHYTCATKHHTCTVSSRLFTGNHWQRKIYHHSMQGLSHGRGTNSTCLKSALEIMLHDS